MYITELMQFRSVLVLVSLHWIFFACSATAAAAPEAGGPYVYKLSPEELRAVLERKEALDFPDQAPHRRPKGRTVSGHIGPAKKNTWIEARGSEVVCLEESKEDGMTGNKWFYTFVSARCDTSYLDNRIYHVTCSSVYREHPWYRYEIPGDPRVFNRWCPYKKTCQNVDLMTDDGIVVFEIKCVDDALVAVEEFQVAEVLLGLQHPWLYCGNPVDIPGTSKQALSAKQLDIVLTEEALWPNWTEYKSPALLIHDKTSQYGYDLSLRRDASVTSAAVTLRAYGGKIPHKQIEFCMRVVPSDKSMWLIFMYSWFVVDSGRRGRIPTEQNLKALQVESL